MRNDPSECVNYELEAVFFFSCPPRGTQVNDSRLETGPHMETISRLH